ncbi:Octanoate-[acyl-carrier-protein]-protein-N-octanoyltransferase, partial [hydrothermal vent metagenome]
QWKILDGLTDYEQTLKEMRQIATEISLGNAQEQVWLLEHPALYTAGTSAKDDDLLMPKKFPVFQAGRGGQFTYHGPGQRVAYVMLDLGQRGKDIRKLVQNLEGWIIDTLAAFNIVAFQVPGKVGVWVNRPELSSKNNLTLQRQDKIAAIGIRVSKWVSFHGISINIAPDLSHYQGIVPCGISDQAVTSFEDLGHLASMAEVDIILRQKFEKHFGPTKAV